MAASYVFNNNKNLGEKNEKLKAKEAQLKWMEWNRKDMNAVGECDGKVRRKTQQKWPILSEDKSSRSVCIVYTPASTFLFFALLAMFRWKTSKTSADTIFYSYRLKYKKADIISNEKNNRVSSERNRLHEWKRSEKNVSQQQEFYFFSLTHTDAVDG